MTASHVFHSSHKAIYGHETVANVWAGARVKQPTMWGSHAPASDLKGPPGQGQVGWETAEPNRQRQLLSPTNHIVNC